jgi:hypothetical protein
LLQFVAVASIFFPLFSPKVKFSIIRKSSSLVSVLMAYAPFFFYHILFFGLAVPDERKGDFFYFIIRHSPEIFGFFVIIPFYIINKDNIEHFYKYIPIIVIASNVFLLNNYYFNAFQDIYHSGIRYGLSRVVFYGVPALNFIIPLFVIQLIKQKKINKLYFLAAFSQAACILLALERARILYIIMLIIIAIYLVHKIYKINLPKIVKLVSIAGMALVIFSFIFPGYFNSIYKMYRDVYYEFFTDKIAFGTFQSRTEKEIPEQFALFKKNPVFGTGYDKKWYANDPKTGGLGATDAPFVAGLGMFGITGIFLYLLFYLKIVMLLRSKLEFLFKYRRFVEPIQTNFVFLAITFSTVLLGELIFFHYYFWELVRGRYAVQWGLWIGIFIISIEKIQQNRAYLN